MTYVPAPNRYDADPLPPVRPSGSSSRRLARALAQLRRHARSRPARHPAAGVRPRRHPLRSGEQLRAALRLRRDEFRRIFGEDFGAYRDELVISTKAGYDMWPGPYGEWGSRKYLLASLDQSLRRMGLDYVDIFYSHRRTPRLRSRRRWGRCDTRCGRARRSTPASRPTRPSGRAQAAAILRRLGTPLLIHQPSYSMLDRWIERGLLGHPRRARHRLHRLLAARPGSADRPVPGRHPRRFAGQPRRVPCRRSCSAARRSRACGA